MTSTEELIRDHQIIVGVLAALDQVLTEADRSNAVPVAFLKNLVTFSQGFIDRCHHGKEEHCLFPCLIQRGIPKEGGMIERMLEEHEMGRTLVCQIAAALEQYERGGAPSDDALNLCRQYIDLLQQHITKENEMLFPTGDGVMSSIDHAETRGCFEEQEESMGHGEHHRLLRLAQEMAARAKE